MIGPVRRSAVWLLVAGFLAASPAHAAYLDLEEIPTESALYGALEALTTRYGTPSGFLQTRPWTLGDARAFLDSLVKSGCACGDDPAFVRVRREVDPEAASQPPAVRLTADTRVVEISPYLRLAYAEDGTRSPSVIRDYRIGGAVAASVTKHLIVFADYYAATYSPGPHGNPIRGTVFSIVEGYQLNSWFDRAFIAWDAGAVSARAGHTWLRWGPGRSGTLGLYDGSLALDLVETRWQVLPKVQLTWFVAWLDALNEHYLAGHRLDLRLNPSWSVGLSELARFNGSSQVPQYLIPVVFYNFREKQVSRFSDASADSQQVFSKNNVMWTADVVWKARPGLQLYGEVVVDDISFSSQYRPTEIGYQAGARVARRLGSRDAAGAVLEFTRVYNYTYSTWHRHDFENDGYPLAYPRGPDVEVILTELGWDHGPDWTATLTAFRARKGEGRIGLPWLPAQGQVETAQLSGVVERTLSASAAMAYRTGRRLQVDAQVGWTSVRNAGHIVRNSVEGWTGSSRVTLRW
jgi:hypothetical protein